MAKQNNNNNQRSGVARPAYRILVGGEGKDDKAQEIGVLWKNTSKSGTTYLSGKIYTIPGKILIFENTDRSRQAESAPDAKPEVDDDLPF